jgi:hypothetical protein
MASVQLRASRLNFALPEELRAAFCELGSGSIRYLSVDLISTQTKSWLSADATEIDSIQNQLKRRWIDLQSCRPEILQIRKFEGPFLEHLVPHGKTSGIPVHYFNPVAMFVFENEQAA